LRANFRPVEGEADAGDEAINRHRIGDESLIKPSIDIPRMAKLATGTVRKALQASVARDDEVDVLHDQVHRELFFLMIANPGTITQATYLMGASHGLERIADLVTNVCARVVFVVTGTLDDLNRPRD